MKRRHFEISFLLYVQLADNIQEGLSVKKKYCERFRDFFPFLLFIFFKFLFNLVVLKFLRASPYYQMLTGNLKLLKM